MDILDRQAIDALAVQVIATLQTPLGQLVKLIGAAISATVASVYTISKLRKFLLDRRNAKYMEVAAGSKSFAAQDFKEARRFYIEPHCSNIDPANENDLRSVISVRELALVALDREIMAEYGHKHILVLADSGMGKTTLLLNLFARHHAKRVRRNKIAIVPLNRDTAIAQIKHIDSPRDTILLLDAFDEDPEVQKNYSKRLLEIMSAASDFRKIVLTCRTQFFAEDDAIPKHTGVWSISPRAAGDSGAHVFRRIYLMPFDIQQTRRYIFKRISFWSWGKRRRAFEYIKNLHDLPFRPMLLAEIPHLAAKNTRISEIFDLYNFMIHRWFKREERWIGERPLHEISRLIATDLLINREQRQSETISPTELDELLREHRISADPSDRWVLTTRSLLNRDSEGQLKFAHRSFVEFFSVDALVNGDRRVLTIPWTHQMREFLLSWLRAASVDDAAKFAISLREENLTTAGIVPLLQLQPSISSDVARDTPVEFSHYLLKRGTLESKPSFLEAELVLHRSLQVKMGNIPSIRLHRIYDLAYGLVLTVPTSFSYSGDIADLSCAIGMRNFQNEQLQSELPHILNLGRVLRCIDLCIGIKTAFAGREAYWLGDGFEIKRRYMFRAATPNNRLSPRPYHLRSEHVAHSVFAAQDRDYDIDIYSTSLLESLAVPIHVSYGSVAATYEHERTVDLWARRYLDQLFQNNRKLNPSSLSLHPNRI